MNLMGGIKVTPLLMEIQVNIAYFGNLLWLWEINLRCQYPHIGKVCLSFKTKLVANCLQGNFEGHGTLDDDLSLFWDFFQHNALEVCIKSLCISLFSHSCRRANCMRCKDKFYVRSLITRSTKTNQTLTFWSKKGFLAGIFLFFSAFYVLQNYTLMRTSTHLFGVTIFIALIAKECHFKNALCVLQQRKCNTLFVILLYKTRICSST